MPDEQIVEIRADGRVILNNMEIDSPHDPDLPELTETIIRFMQVCASARNEAMLIINADDGTPHQRVVDVLNACAAAKLTNVTFAFEDEEELL